jgi:hypothetical protein
MPIAYGPTPLRHPFYSAPPSAGRGACLRAWRSASIPGSASPQRLGGDRRRRTCARRQARPAPGKVAHGSRLGRGSRTHEEGGTSPKSVSRNSTGLIVPYKRAWKHAASTWRESASSPEKYEPRYAPFPARSAKFVASKANFEPRRPNSSARSTANVASKVDYELRSPNSSARSTTSVASKVNYEPRSPNSLARSTTNVTSKANHELRSPDSSARSTTGVASKANYELRSRNSSARSLPSEPSDRPIDARSLPIVARYLAYVRRSLLHER